MCNYLKQTYLERLEPFRNDLETPLFEKEEISSTQPLRQVLFVVVRIAIRKQNHFDAHRNVVLLQRTNLTNYFFLTFTLKNQEKVPRFAKFYSTRQNTT